MLWSSVLRLCEGLPCIVEILWDGLTRALYGTVSVSEERVEAFRVYCCCFGVGGVVVYLGGPVWDRQSTRRRKKRVSGGFSQQSSKSGDSGHVCFSSTYDSSLT